MEATRNIREINEVSIWTVIDWYGEDPQGPNGVIQDTMNFYIKHLGKNTPVNGITYNKVITGISELVADSVEKIDGFWIKGVMTILKYRFRMYN